MIAVPIEALGYELVGIEFIRDHISTLHVYIGNEDDINVGDCVDVSHQVGVMMDVEDPITATYNLEAPSPDLDHPLFAAGHYIRFLDEEVTPAFCMAVQDHYRWQGIIGMINSEMITVTVENKDGVFVPSGIQKVSLVPHFQQSGLR